MNLKYVLARMSQLHIKYQIFHSDIHTSHKIFKHAIPLHAEMEIFRTYLGCKIQVCT